MIIDVETFEKSYQDARAYHFRAEQFLQEGQRHSLVFNVASVALEQYLVALCELNGDPPANHDFEHLVDVAEQHVEFPEELNKKIRYLDEIFGICSIENYHHKIPLQSDSEQTLNICNEIYKLFDQSKIQSIRLAYKKQEEKSPFLRIA